MHASWYTCEINALIIFTYSQLEQEQDFILHSNKQTKTMHDGSKVH